MREAHARNRAEMKSEIGKTETKFPKVLKLSSSVVEKPFSNASEQRKRDQLGFRPDNK